MKTKNPAKKIIALFVAVLLVIAAIVLIAFYFEYNAMKEIGGNFTNVFFTNLKARVLAQVISFLIVFLIAYLSFNGIRKNLQKVDSSYDFLNKKYLIVIATLIFSIFASSIIQSNLYDRLLLFLHPTKFDLTDPIFYKDLGYYMFQRPFLMSLIDSALGVMVLVSIIVLIAYVMLYARLGIVNVKDIFKVRSIAVHNIINLSLIILIKALTYQIKAEEILFGSSNILVGAGYTDVHIWKTYYSIMPFILIAVVALAIIFLWKNKIKLSFYSILVYPVTYICFLGTALITETFIVRPQEVTVEAPYIENSIEYTKSAYNLSDVASEVFDIKYNLTKEDINKNKNTLKNARIIDYGASLKSTNQVQSIRNYYKFNDIDIVKYDLDDGPEAVFIAPREFNKEALDPNSRSFINEKLRFTHGYGLVAGKVNEVTKEGQPDFIIKDIPPKSTDSKLEIKEPRIYYGESTNDYVVVNSKYKEFDYSLGDSAEEYSYQGKSGIKMNLLNRVMYSLYYGDFQLLISKLVTDDSKILINRNVMERVKKVAPFLETDDDPYMVIDSNGRAKWVVNCYTVSNEYPYAQKVLMFNKSINYMRESVKAVVDAYDGTVKFYITDDKDPIAESYKKIYPGFFEEEKMPDDIFSHIQYPETMFKVQSEIMKRYHVDNSGVFYNKTDVWDFAKEKYQNEERYVEPYYTMLSLFGDKDALTLMIPYTMSNKQNLVAWMAVSCDKDSYGKTVLYTFPKGESIYGIMQMENKIDNDPEISRQMTLWGNGGSSVIRGNMLVIPVANSLLYVEPVYITSGEQNSLPELKRVILCYNDRIVMEENFDKAIFKMFDYKLSEDSDVVTEVKPQIPDVVTPVNPVNNPVVNNFDKVKKSMSEGNWAEFGNNMAELEKEIDKLR